MSHAPESRPARPGHDPAREPSVACEPPDLVRDARDPSPTAPPSPGGPHDRPRARTPHPRPGTPAVTPGGATALLDAYRPGDRFLATPGRTLLGSGTAAEIPHEPAVPLGERVRRALDARRTAGDPAPVVLGCLPFL
ncbi:hypothetical protein GA0115246_107891, partial [Streptomyces sp. SolWspMP-sol7th]